MTKIKIIFTLLFITLVSTGCASNKVIEEQQKKIDYLTSQLASTTEQIKILNEQNDVTTTNETSNANNTVPKNIPSATSANNTQNITKEPPAEDPLIKIERCKSQAKYKSDNVEIYTIEEITDVLNSTCGGENYYEGCSSELFDQFDELIISEREKLYNKYYSECLVN